MRETGRANLVDGWEVLKDSFDFDDCFDYSAKVKPLSIGRYRLDLERSQSGAVCFVIEAFYGVERLLMNERDLAAWIKTPRFSNPEDPYEPSEEEMEAAVRINKTMPLPKLLFTPIYQELRFYGGDIVGNHGCHLLLRSENEGDVKKIVFECLASSLRASSELAHCFFSSRTPETHGDSTTFIYHLSCEMRELLGAERLAEIMKMEMVHDYMTVTSAARKGDSNAQVLRSLFGWPQVRYALTHHRDMRDKECRKLALEIFLAVDAATPVTGMVEATSCLIREEIARLARVIGS